MTIRAALVAAAFVSLPCAAQTADPLPQPLEDAVRAAELAGAAAPRFAFTRTLDMENPSVRLVARFDPSAPAGERWTLLSPDEGSLPNGVAAEWERMRGEDDADVDVLVDEPRSVIGQDAALSAEDADTLEFESSLSEHAQLDAGGSTDRMRDVMRVAATVTRDGPRLTRIRVFARERFRPAMVARVDHFEQAIEVSDAWESGPAVIARMEQSVRGSAMFQDFDETVILTHSDFAPAR